MALAPDVPYDIGDAAFGGYVAGLIDTTQGNIIAADASQTGARYVLIVSPKTLEQASMQYKISQDAAPAAARTRWNGLAATTAMASTTYPAANYCYGLAYPSDGGSRWYLPAMDELEVIYRNLKATTESNYKTSQTAGEFPGGADFVPGYNPSSDPSGASYTAGNPAQTPVVAFRDGGGQDLGDAGSNLYFWTATEHSAAYTWIQYASGSYAGFQGGNSKAGNSRVRPVRRILVSDLNTAPNPPTLQYPTGNVILDRTVSNQFDMGAFSDPDAGDSLSAYDLRYAPRSTTSWTTVSGGATRYHTFAGGTFAAGDWDWQAQYYDAAGEPSGWSTTAQFRMGTPPGEPTIVDPINGGVIEGPNYLAEFTASGTYDGSEWRTVADSAGSPDPGTVYWSSGVVEGTGTTYTIPFATDGRYEHLQVRLRNDTFFSSWYSVRVNVNYLKQGSGSPIGYDFTTAGATGEQPPNKGSGSSDYAYSGSASGERSPVGTGSTGYTYDGTAAGEFPAKGSGLAIEYDFSGLAEGERIPEASGSTGYAYSGSAVGNAPTDGSGVAVGSYAYSGSALGRKDPEGSGVAGFVYDGEATGLIVVSGSGQASVAWIGQAAGSIEKQGSGSIGYAFAFTEATGETPPNKGTGSAGYAFTGSAVGEGKPRGSGVIAYAYSGSAVGGTVRLIFEPPTQRQAVRGDALFSRVSVPVGLSVVRTDGQYRTTPSPWLGELVGLKDGTDYFLGGHRYEVTNEVAAELQAAGYDVQSV